MESKITFYLKGVDASKISQPSISLRRMDKSKMSKMTHAEKQEMLKFIEIGRIQFDVYANEIEEACKL